MSQYSFELGKSHHFLEFSSIEEESPEVGVVLRDSFRGRLYRVTSINPHKIIEIDLFPKMEPVIG